MRATWRGSPNPAPTFFVKRAMKRSDRHIHAAECAAQQQETRGGSTMTRLRSAYLTKAGVALVVATLVAATLRQAEAQDLSGAPIKLIVAVAAGDAADVTARRLAHKMS